MKLLALKKSAFIWNRAALWQTLGIGAPPMVASVGETRVAARLEFSEWQEKPASSAHLNNDNWF
jgi:hypothetical protein